ncbi:FAD-dependent oxidoreductase [Atopobium sp. oral taxon 810]|uniref:NAD(P)/FAD-dependent oxidoreductase n=1 Tax=Atopobium sp. oral taxon 810 TaxID=712158 RepID=UPI00039648B4|nr:FAD-dependent oxidoreductase [Atopobium sp. oral taxon 810]ERI03883.1 putative thioredoxin-disulfide reductase [Atopobium sp. oral taxon 810 str. F0209]
MANEAKTTLIKDMVIVGGGPAGLTAAIYAQRAMLDTVLLEQEAVGGQVISTSEIDNYPGVPHTDGFTLTDAMQHQAEDLGAKIEMSIVEGIEHTGEGRFLVHTPEANYDSATVIVAGGATPRHAGFEGEEKYAGRGVSYCATCDGMFYRGKKVFVIGGGNSACEEALFLTRFADEVVLVVRKDHLRAQASVAKLVDENPKLTVRYLSSIVRVEGGQLLSAVTFRNNVTGEETTETYAEGSFGVFVFVGRVPATELIADMVELDSKGYVVTNDRLETKTAGLYAAGDLRQKPLRQIITAAADGAIAVNSASSYLGQPVEG